ncbi:MAG TPA: ABC transporter ATP-binding protein [Acidimicrobiia bacterium]|nr:ABC transporter ATP-binding protein [Acidimicrobiia bacterium]
MTLDARVRLELGALALDVELSARPGEMVVIVGPNGAGKTTLLRALAGLQPLDAGSVTLDGVVLDDAEAGVLVPPDRRPVGIVFQDGLLFPNLSALENVAFGLRSRGVRRSEARREAAEWLQRVGLAGREQARPAELSGGQAQQVALARALAPHPRLLLLDEPLAALDATTRVEVRRDLRRHLASYDGVRILVTHDPLEALALATTLVVVENGRVVQSGPPDDVRARPRSRYVADLVGVNLLAGTGRGRDVVLGSGARLTVAEALPAGDVLAVLHPRAVALHRGTRPGGSPRNAWEGTVGALDFEGDRVRVRLDGPVPLVAEVTPAAVRDLGVEEGSALWASAKATEITVYPA